MTTRAPTFDEQFVGLARIAHRVGFRLLGSREEAEEVAQEALAWAYVRWGSISGHAEPWVARVATNLAIGRWRRRRPTVAFEHGDGHSPAQPGHDSHALERLGLVQALAQLPRRQREAVALRFLADLSERDAAAAMNTSIGSVKRHTHRALARLRVELAPLPLTLEAEDV